MLKDHIIQQFLDEGYLLSPEILDLDIDPSLLPLLQKKFPTYDKPVVLTKDILQAVAHTEDPEFNWSDFERSRVSYEKKTNVKVYETFLQHLGPLPESSFLRSTLPSESSSVTVTPVADLSLPSALPSLPEVHNSSPELELPRSSPSPITLLGDYTTDSRKIEIKDFVHFFRSRYEKLRKILQHRQELQNATSINRVLQKQDGEETVVIGLVYEKSVTKAGNILLQIEDSTGIVKAIVSKNDLDLFRIAENLCYDEVLGIVGKLHSKNIFVKSIVFPEILNTRKDIKCDEEVYACFISDIHVGSKVFLEKEFERFIAWLNGGIGTDQQKHIAQCVKYIFMIGDLVDGVGVFPGQEDHLLLTDLRAQYERLSSLLSRIRPDITFVICPGNHDSSRAAEPQPPLDKDYAELMWARLPNAVFVTNPSYVRIHQTPTFEGYTLLLYHGASFHYFIDNIPTLRQNKSRDNPSYIMKFLLQRRHLAPAHTSSTYVPTTKDDVLVIDQVPDIFVSGDMHRSDVSSYNGVITINCSCWQSKTDYQEKTGNNPDPCKVPVFSLKDRAVFMLNFSNEEIQ